ncbi:hypothetical protein [Jatrophihabitans sp.]|uniref:hypothetical protein n=1 Tax=Jatrophihabitans sp. TaxID=1932789 RepID=UPI002C6687A5|nr:hypothetical protein [Jatrophihabitans sp.]
MRRAFAHTAELLMPAPADDGAPGAAITVALCGHWEHQPPCPLAPHATRADRDGDTVRLRTLFATEPDRADEVHRRIDQALQAGELIVPDGTVTRWRLTASGPAEPTAAEHDHAERLIRS